LQQICTEQLYAKHSVGIIKPRWNKWKLRSLLFWVVIQHRLVVTDILGQIVSPIFKGKSVKEEWKFLNVMYIVLCLGMKAVHSWYSSIILWFPFSKDSALCFDLQMWCGYDGLSKKVLKLCRSQISKPITYISNKSLTCGICPNRLKYAIIKPFFFKERWQITSIKL